MFDCGCHDHDTSDALNMAFFVHSPWKPTTTQKNNGGFKNLFPTLLPFLQESLLSDGEIQNYMDSLRKAKNFCNMRHYRHNIMRIAHKGRKISFLSLARALLFILKLNTSLEQVNEDLTLSLS